MAILIGTIIFVCSVLVWYFTAPMNKNNDADFMRANHAWLAGGVCVLLTTIFLNPVINIWVNEMEGKAEYAKAEYNRQIKVLEAQAMRDSAKLYAEAEVERAQGVAKANAIVQDGLGGPEGYLRYLYIQAIEKGSEHGTMQFVYVPTEAGMPILEAGRLTSKLNVVVPHDDKTN